MKLTRLPGNAPSAGLQCRVPCKINLFLEVLGKRPDGYHELDTIMHAVDLCDTLEIRRREDGQVRLRVVLPDDGPLAPGDPAWRIPSDDSNLTVRALKRLQQALGTSCGADLSLRKQIPAQAGLGGGSADTAAALVLGALAWSERLDLRMLGELASELGSDVNFFLDGWNGRWWTARCTGRGERVSPIHQASPLHVVLMHPPQGCSTGDVFRALAGECELGGGVWEADAREANGAKTQLGGATRMEVALERGENDAVGAMLYNRLARPASQCTDWVDRSASRFDRYNPLGHGLSGSGSARFCLCSTAEEADKIASALRSYRDTRVFTATSWESPSLEKQADALRTDP